MNEVVCLTVLGAAFIPFSQKQYLLFCLFVLCWGLASATSKMTTGFTPTPLPSNTNWMCRAVIFAQSANLHFYSIAHINLYRFCCVSILIAFTPTYNNLFVVMKNGIFFLMLGHAEIHSMKSWNHFQATQIYGSGRFLEWRSSDFWQLTHCLTHNNWFGAQKPVLQTTACETAVCSWQCSVVQWTQKCTHVYF